jgi:ubiquinone/menaquinone biosynthesis C-methylase UbiE
MKKISRISKKESYRMVEKDDVNKFIMFYNSKFGEEVVNKEVKFVESKLIGGKKVLSIGCGSAILETRLHRRHPEMAITGLDNSKQMIDQASKSGIHVEYGDATHLKFNDDSFDAVIYVTSLEFITNFKGSLIESHRVLNPKGRLLILMLNSKSHYFKVEYADRNSYIRKNIKHMDMRKIKSFVSQYFFIDDELYYLGVQDRNIIDSRDPKLASLYILEGMKVGK